MVGVGRGSYNKTYDAFSKFKILRQSSGAKVMPVSLSYMTSVEMNTLKFPIRPDGASNYASSRFTYVSQFACGTKVQ